MANQIAYEAVTVSTAAVGPTAATATQLAKAAVFYLEPGTGEVRHRADGTAPTSSVGLPIEQGGHMVVVGNGNIINAQFIRHSAAASDGTLHCMYYDAVDIVEAIPHGGIIQGNVAHDAADSGNPIKVGGIAETTGRSTVADGDRVNAFFNEYGLLGVMITETNAGNKARVLRPNGDGLSTGAYALGVNASTYALGPDGSWDRLRSSGNTAGSGLGALMVSPTGHAHNSVTADEQILSAAGKLHTITVHDVTTGGVLTVYDNTAESGTVIATLTLAAGEGFVTLHYDVHCGTGLYMGYDASLAGAFTVSYSV
jgi:hypothetical protein